MDQILWRNSYFKSKALHQIVRKKSFLQKYVTLFTDRDGCRQCFLWGHEEPSGFSGAVHKFTGQLECLIIISGVIEMLISLQ